MYYSIDKEVMFYMALFVEDIIKTSLKCTEYMNNVSLDLITRREWEGERLGPIF